MRSRARRSPAVARAPRLCLAAGLCLAAALALTACADPVDEAPRDGQAPRAPLESQEVDPARDALRTELEALRSLLATARDHLAEAAGTEGSAASTDAALELLIGDPPGDTAPLFPVERGARGAGGGRADRLTSVLTVTREAGGAVGGDVRELLRDLVAGDLGAWQRDAEGMIDRVEDAASPDAPLEETEEAVFALAGEATRALAWTLLARDADDPEAAGAYAGRGATHLDVAVSAIDELDLEGAQ